MADGEDDYLSDKFLASLEASSSTKVRTYEQRRQEAKRVSEQKNLANRVRSRKEVEEESRREGLSKSLFQRAREDDERANKRRRLGEGESISADPGQPALPQNKALAMMLKMGFREGESLGKKEETLPAQSTEMPAQPTNQGHTGHLVEPIPLTVWTGRQGLGSGRRTFAIHPSQDVGAKIKDEAEIKEDYRNLARNEFEQKRDLGRLGKARKTLLNLDEKRGIPFNILWIDPTNEETIPGELRMCLEDGPTSPERTTNTETETNAIQLRTRMQRDALQPLSYDADHDGAEIGDEAAPSSKVTTEQVMDFDDDTVQDTRDWLLLSVQDRLRFTLERLRQEYFYCFWCGAQYVDQKEMDELCPGVSESAHN